MLSNVPYGRNGSWALNIWLRASGPAHVVKRVFSNADARTQNTLSTLWGANQVHGFLTHCMIVMSNHSGLKPPMVWTLLRENIGFCSRAIITVFRR